MSYESHGTGRKVRTFASRLQRPLPYRLAIPVYLCTSPPNPDSPQRTSNSFLRPTGHGLFFLSLCYHYEVHERRNFSCLYERNKRLSGVDKECRPLASYLGSRCSAVKLYPQKFCQLNFVFVNFVNSFLSFDKLSISH